MYNPDTEKIVVPFKKRFFWKKIIVNFDESSNVIFKGGGGLGQKRLLRNQKKDIICPTERVGV